MLNFTKCLIATATVALTVCSATADERIASGTVKSVNAEAKSFVLTDITNKDFTFKIGDNLLVNRAGKESKSDLKVGDSICACYDKGILHSTTHFILVREGSNKNCELVRGNVKAYDASRKELTVTNELKADATYAMGNATVSYNREDGKIENVTIGEAVTIMVDSSDNKRTLRSVMIDRAKTN